MMQDAIEQRRATANTIRALRDGVADRMTSEFLRRHPDWSLRYGEAAWDRGVEDARFHVDFLAGAIESGDTSTFGEYGRWTATMLSSRGIDPIFVIENLVQLRDEMQLLLTAPESALVAEHVAAACEAIRSGERTANVSDRLAAPRSVFTQAILNGERAAALTVALELLREGATVPDIYCDVLQPAQYEVGRLWEQNEISVAREHAATAITQFVVAQMYSRLEVPTRSRGAAVVTGVEGELHQLGANMVADVLESDGWNVRFLGTQLPRRDILNTVDEHEATLLGISAMMLFNLNAVIGLIDEARNRFGSELCILVGGGAFRMQPELWREIGADGYAADLRGARRTARALTGE